MLLCEIDPAGIAAYSSLPKLLPQWFSLKFRGQSHIFSHVIFFICKNYTFISRQTVINSVSDKFTDYCTRAIRCDLEN